MRVTRLTSPTPPARLSAPTVVRVRPGGEGKRRPAFNSSSASLASQKRLYIYKAGSDEKRPSSASPRGFRQAPTATF